VLTKEPSRDLRRSLIAIVQVSENRAGLGVRATLQQVVREDPDSLVLRSAIDALRAIALRETQLRSLLASRITKARASNDTALVPMLLERPSVDLLITPAHESAIVRTRDRGVATVWTNARGYHYRRVSGDPLGLGTELGSASMDDAYDATLESDYPDGIVQIVHLATAPRSGEIVLSASRDWDFRARYEPIRHISSHGALHREHMLVPLLVNQSVTREPRRTVDVMPSALTALGLPVPSGLDGESFL